MSRIKTAKRVNSFAFNLENNRNIMYSPTYKDRVKKCYNLSFLPREEIERMDKKLGYSYSNESEKDNNKRGIYTEDVFERIKQELADPEKFKKYVLKGREDVREEDIFKYKLEFFLENMDKFSTYNSNARYLENIRYYFYTLKVFFGRRGKKNKYVCMCETMVTFLKYIYCKIKNHQKKQKEKIHILLIIIPIENIKKFQEKN